jgi:hypothetical protein
LKDGDDGNDDNDATTLKSVVHVTSSKSSGKPNKPPNGGSPIAKLPNGAWKPTQAQLLQCSYQNTKDMLQWCKIRLTIARDTDPCVVPSTAY